MIRNKRTKAVDIVGRWVKQGDNIVKYTDIPKNIKCSKCIDGLDPECPICHGSLIKTPIKWYQLKKRLDKWLE